MSEFHGRRVSRRELLRSTAVGAVALVLGACQPKVVEVEKIVTKEVERVVEKEVAVTTQSTVDVKIIVVGWVDTQWAISQRANDYNASQDKVRVTIVPMPEGWETKAMSQIEKGAPAWDGYLSLHPFRFAVQYLAQGLIQPIDDYLETNSILNVDEFWGDCIDPEKTKYDCSVKDMVMGVPLGIDTCCQGFRADLLKEAGLPYTREDFMKERSWDQITDWALALREKHKEQGIWGISNHSVYHQSLGQIYQSITKDLYDSDGLIKFDSDAMRKALQIQTDWALKGAGPVPLWSAAFQEGKVALWVGQVGVNGAAQRAWGRDRVPDAMPAHVEGGTGGNQWYTTCGFVLNKAAHPQEVVDFYLWMFGPQNDAHAQLCLQYNWFPVFKSQWAKLIEPKPENQWAMDFLPQFGNASLIPRNPYYEIEHTVVCKYSELAQAGKITVDEACTQTRLDIKDQISKLKIDW